MNSLPIKINLPDDFLEEEMRCGYKVSSDVKSVWAVELDLYEELNRVCNKYNLNLFADAGTVLGAVRHSGFIPWDDDLDFSMTRKDYIKLCSVAKEEFKYPYFWQTEETEPGAGKGHGQLRNSKTTAIVKGEIKGKYNQGIFVDVFPLDNVPDDDNERKKYMLHFNKLRKKRDYYRDMMFGINVSSGLKRILKAFLIKHYYSHKRYNNKAYRALEDYKQKYLNSDTKYFANFLFVKESNPDYLVRPKKWYDGYKEVKFENTIVKVPICYEEYLIKAYGEWQKYVIGASVHGDVIFDPYKSYLEY